MPDSTHFASSKNEDEASLIEQDSPYYLVKIPKLIIVARISNKFSSNLISSTTVPENCPPEKINYDQFKAPTIVFVIPPKMSSQSIRVTKCDEALQKSLCPNHTGSKLPYLP